MSNEIVIHEPKSAFLAPAANLDEVLFAYQVKKEFIEKVLKKDQDYGSVSGSKPALYKPGAEKLGSFFGLRPIFEDIETVEDWTGENHGGEPFFYYRQKCLLYHADAKSGPLVGTADGSCNSWEKKYRYRQAERVCPNCGQPAIIKGRAEYGGGWVCFKKKGGCNAKFGDNDERIASQEIGQVKNPDPAEQVNTILKMAQKRALVAAILIATGASDYFTQDIEDYVDAPFVEQPERQPEAPKQQPRPQQKPTVSTRSNSPVVALVEAGICENTAAAAQLINSYVPNEIRGNIDAVIEWGHLYRGWRNTGAEPADAARNATENLPFD